MATWSAWASGVLLVVGLAWAVAPLAVLRSAAGAADPEPSTGGPSPVDGPPVTVLVRVGDEPWSAVRPTVLLAASGGPTVIVSARRSASRMNVAGVPVVVRPSVEEAIADALDDVTTDWVQVVSARSAPERSACAAALRDVGDAAWVVARAGSLDARRHTGTRSVVSELLRDRVRGAGVWLWEPDAVLVTAATLRARPLQPGVAFGAWLRERAREGLIGRRSRRVVAWRSDPTGGAGFWALTFARQRAAVADLADALRSSRGRPRRAVAAVLARELYGPAVLAVTVPWWVTLLGGRSPFPWSAAWPLAAVVAGAVVRYGWLRRWLGVYPQPAADAWSAVAGIPGSLSAVVAVVGDRPLSNPSPAPGRPLVWLALLLTLTTGVGLVAQTSGERASGASVACSVLTLALLWLLGLRSLAERDGQRSGLRVGLDIPVRVGAVEASGIDASVDGLAVRWPPGVTAPGRGEHLAMAVELAGRDRELAVRVVSCRRSARGDTVGLRLEHGPAVASAWLEVVRTALAHGPVRPRRRAVVGHDARPARRGDRVLLAAGLATTALVLAVLVPILAGYQPFVVRSPSMTPTFRIGDVVVVDSVRAGDVVVGEVITRPASAEWGERLTHRVDGRRLDGGDVVFATRGDANADSERWRIPVDARLERVVAAIPWVGRPLLALRVHPLVTIGFVAAVATLLVRFRRRQPDRERDHVDAADGVELVASASGTHVE